ncbi:MAG: hypothetical protein ACI8ZF_000193 [Candidatus Midichloriaceae bacterium]|jgi:hypothetical protein
MENFIKSMTVGFLTNKRVEKVNFILFCVSMVTIFFTFFLGIYSDVNLDKNSYGTDIFSKAVIEQPIADQNNVLEDIFDEVNYIPSDTKYVVRSGDTLIKILTSFGISYSDAHNMSKGISKVYNLKNLNVGKEVRFIFNGKEGNKIKL